MVDEREEWLARRFDVLADVDVPDVWDQIVGRADTEPVLDVLAERRRRWVPVTAAAAVLVILGIGLFTLLGDDPETPNTPSNAASTADNTVEVVGGDGDNATVTPTATAGIVTFHITNPTPDNRSLEIRRMLPGMTLDDVRRNLEQYVRTGSSDVDTVEDPAVLGIVHGPDDSFTTTMPLTAGDYAVFLNVADEKLAAVPDRLGEVRMLTVEGGDAGNPPTPTLRFRRQAVDYLIADTNVTTAGPATIHVDNTAGGEFVISLIELRPDATQLDFNQFLDSVPPGETVDWTSAPAASYRYFYAGAPDQTVTVDLRGGDLRVEAPPSFGEEGAFSFQWVTVE